MTTKWSFFAYGKDILPDFSPMEGEKRAAPGRPLPKILFAVKDARHNPSRERNKALTSTMPRDPKPGS